MIVKFEKTDSFLHRLNPVAKFSVLLSYGLIVFLAGSLPLELACIGCVFLLERIAGSRQISAFVLSRFMVTFVAVILVMQILMTRSGTVVGSIPFYFTRLDITSEGIDNGLLISMRFLSVVILGALFIAVTNPADFVYSLMRIGVPYRFGFMIILAMRLAAVFEQELKTLTNAQKMRGLHIDQSGARTLLLCLRSTVVPLIVCALSRVDDLVVSMEGRAFGCRKTRTFVAPKTWTLVDKTLLVASSAMALLVLLNLVLCPHFPPHLLPRM